MATPFTSALRTAAGGLTRVGRFGKKKLNSPWLAKKAGRFSGKVRKYAMNVEAGKAGPVGGAVNNFVTGASDRYNKMSTGRKKLLKAGGATTALGGAYLYGKRRQRKSHGNRYPKQETED